MLPHSFEKKISYEPNSGCWLWMQTINAKGYGLYNSKMAHRVAYESLRQKVPSGFCIDHLCRVRSCVNPDHMEIVTPQENQRRGRINQYKMATHCIHGHEFTAENTILNKKGHRQCRVCGRQRFYAYRRRRRGG